MSDGGSFVCIWAGDSRAYLSRNGELRQLTHDHCLVQELLDAGEITPAEADRHPNANVITRAVGSSPILETETVDGRTMTGDAFLLASDGLTRLVNERELLSALTAPNLEAGADTLLALSLDRGAPDNVTFLMVRAFL
jgi:serine/threonine protein phosphatase PrpC